MNLYFSPDESILSKKNLNEPMLICHPKGPVITPNSII